MLSGRLFLAFSLFSLACLPCARGLRFPLESTRKCMMEPVYAGQVVEGSFDISPPDGSVLTLITQDSTELYMSRNKSDKFNFKAAKDGTISICFSKVRNMKFEKSMIDLLIKPPPLEAPDRSIESQKTILRSSNKSLKVYNNLGNGAFKVKQWAHRYMQRSTSFKKTMWSLRFWTAMQLFTVMTVIGLQALWVWYALSGEKGSKRLQSFDHGFKMSV